MLKNKRLKLLYQLYNQGTLLYLRSQMGNYKTVNRNVDNTKRERLFPEPEYQVKTRAPNPAGNAWRDNILLRIREQQLSDESMPLARRKCYDPAMQFLQCQKKQGAFWYVFNCQEVYQELSDCLEHEFNVEMDKRRRDMERNPQIWWRKLYDQNGEVGNQAAQPKQEITLWDDVKYTLFGDDTKFKNL